MSFVYYNWEEVDINWEALDLNWEEVGFLISDVLPAVGGAPFAGGKPEYDLKKLNKLPKEKKRQIIRIVCKIQGTEYEEYKYKNDEDINITVEHIDIIVNRIINNIKVNVQNIS
jgi:hypothetical protein